MSSPPRSTVLITGASSGIGKATALYLARRGYHVLASSRELGRLDELMAQGGAESLPISAHQLDVNDQVSVAAVVPRILDQVGALDALINNAGYGLWGCLEDLTMEEVKVQFETNLFAVLRMSQAVLPHMRERRRGTIINVGSVAGRIGSPGGGAYAASKFALEGLTKVLRMEVSQFGIWVVLIEPGLFRTNFHRDLVMGQRALDPLSPYYNYVQRRTRNSGGIQRWAGDPMKVARVIGNVLSSGHPRQRYPVGADAHLGNLAARFLPDGVLEYIIKKVVGR